MELEMILTWSFYNGKIYRKPLYVLMKKLVWSSAFRDESERVFSVI